MPPSKDGTTVPRPAQLKHAGFRWGFFDGHHQDHHQAGIGLMPPTRSPRVSPTRPAKTRLTSNGRSHPLESGAEIRLQILDVFEADGKAQGGTWRIPRRRAAITPAIEGNDKALEAAP
jgi:hypothetical protein